MMVFTIAAVGIFQNSVALGLSYGVCVSTLMLGTDLLIALGMVVVWELHPLFPLAYLCCFGFIDSVFFTANLTKIPKGFLPLSYRSASPFPLFSARSLNINCLHSFLEVYAGGWFAVMLAAIIAVFSYVWFGGTALKKRSAIENMVRHHPCSWDHATGLSLIKAGPMTSGICTNRHCLPKLRL